MRRLVLGTGLGLALLSLTPSPALAGTASRTAEGTIRYEASAGEANRVAVSRSGDDLKITDTGVGSVTAGEGCSASGNTATCPAAAARALVIEVRDRDDQVSVQAALPGGALVTVDGGEGNDLVGGGFGEVEALRGGPGDDFMAGGEGVDALDGGAGADVLLGGPDGDSLAGGSGNDGLDAGPGSDRLAGDGGADAHVGGAGTDTVDYAARSARVVVTLDGNRDDGESGETDDVGADVNLDNTPGGG